MLKNMLWLALAGAMGTLARIGLMGVVRHYGGNSFPFATIAVNITGCFFTGILWVLFEKRLTVHPDIRLLVFAGFMGAFTTFSAFALDTGELLRSAGWMNAGLNIAAQNILGLAALFAGAFVAGLL